MIYSNACAYAIRAMSILAMVRPAGYVLVEELCEGSDLPRHFVAKIFQELVRKGVLASAKGRGGGFALARKPGQITLYDIVKAVDGVDHLDECVVGMAQCDDDQPCPQHEHWKSLRCQLRDYLIQTSLDQLSLTLKSKLEQAGEAIPQPRSKSKPVR